MKVDDFALTYVRAFAKAGTTNSHKSTRAASVSTPADGCKYGELVTFRDHFVTFYKFLVTGE